MSSPVLPGRLGSPDMSLRDDPRADPRMIAAMEPFGLGDRAAPAPVDASSPIEDLLEFVVGGRGGLRGAVRRGRGRHARCRGRRAQRRGHQGSRRQRRDRLHPPSGRSSRCRCPACCTCTAAAWCSSRPPARRTAVCATSSPRSGLVVVGVEFRNGGGKHGPLSVPGRSQRLRRGAALDHRPQGEPRHRQAHRRRGVGRREPHLGDDVAGEARRIARPHRRRLRDVPVHLERLGVAGCRARLVVRERRVLPRRVDDGRAREGVRPVRRSRLRSAGVAACGRAPTTSPACLPTSSR